MRYILRFLCTIVLISIEGCSPSGNEKSSVEATSSSKVPDRDEKKGTKVTCPVCGLTFSTKEAAGTFTYKDKQYFFFIRDHLNTFKNSPDTYLEMISSDATIK